MACESLSMMSTALSTAIGPRVVREVAGSEFTNFAAAVQGQLGLFWRAD
jgi:hypothetical protein